MNKVLRVINRFNLGGPTYNVALLTKYLPNNFQTRLLGGLKDANEADSQFILKNIGVEAQIIADMQRSINPLKDLRAFFKLIQIIREYKPDIIHTHASKAGTLGRLAAIISGVPIIVHTYHGHVFHSYFSTFKTFIFKKIEHFLANKSDAIIVISEQQKKELCYDLRIIPDDKTHIIPLGFDLSRFTVNNTDKRLKFRAKYNISANEILVVIVGRLVPIKNHNMFLEVAKAIENRQSQSNIRYMIVGDGDLRSSLVQQAKNLGFTVSEPERPNHEAKIIFSSWIKEIETVYSGADISALTSLNEGTPVSLIESLASGIPVVSTSVGGISDFITDSEHGFLVTSNNVEQFAKRLWELATDSEKRKKMGQSGQAKVQGIFDYHRLVDDTTKLYIKLLNEKGNIAN